MERDRGPARQGTRAVLRVPVGDVRPSPLAPRRLFSRASVDALAESIRLHGLLNPLLVRPAPGGGWELIAGTRRLMALKRLGRSWVDVLPLPAEDCEGGLLALVENLHREDLHYLDVARACRALLDAQPITQDRLAAGLGMSPSALNNRLRLLRLPDAVQAALRRAGLSERHARALLRLDSERAQLEYLSLAAEQQWSVKQLEDRIAHRTQHERRHPTAVARLARDNRLVVNAVLDTVRRLTRIGVPVRSRVEERPDHIDVIVTIPAVRPAQAEPAAPQR